MWPSHLGREVKKGREYQRKRSRVDSCSKLLYLTADHTTKFLMCNWVNRRRKLMYQTAKQSAEACKVNLPEFKYVKNVLIHVITDSQLLSYLLTYWNAIKAFLGIYKIPEVGRNVSKTVQFNKCARTSCEKKSLIFFSYFFRSKWVLKKKLLYPRFLAGPLWSFCSKLIPLQRGCPPSWTLSTQNYT